MAHRFKLSENVQKGEIIQVGDVEYEVFSVQKRYVNDEPRYVQLFLRHKESSLEDSKDITVMFPLGYIVRIKSR